METRWYCSAGWGRGAVLATGAHVLSQCLRSVALLIGSELLFHGTLGLPLFSCGVLSASATMLCLMYRPSLGLIARHAAPVVASGIVSATSTCLWGYGLTHCGPFRVVLLDHSELCAAFLLHASLCHLQSKDDGSSRSVTMGRRPSKPGQFRGALGLLLAYALLLGTHGMPHRRGVGGAGEMVQFPGMPSNELLPVSNERYLQETISFYDSALTFVESASGELALIAAAILNAARITLTRRLATTIGPNRLLAISHASGALLALPAAALSCTSSLPSASASYVASVLSLCSVITFAFFSLILPSQAATAATAWLGPQRSAVLGLYAACVSALALDVGRGLFTDTVAFSPLLLLCSALVIYGVGAIHSDGPPDFEHLLPLSRDAYMSTSLSDAIWRALFGSRNSRRMVAFLSINVLLMMLELGYGFFSNSLSLIADGAHMLLDVAAIAIGLAGSAVARWHATSAFPYGYDRAETIGSLANALLLLSIVASVGVESIHRLIWSSDLPRVDDKTTLPVAVAGLAVNVLGLALFSDQHVHFGHGCCIPAASQTHRGIGNRGEAQQIQLIEGLGSDSAVNMSGFSNDNTRAVILHIIADACGSIGAIVSSLAVRCCGWHWADPVCSLATSLMLLASVVPMIRRSAAVLLLAPPADLGDESSLGLVQREIVEEVHHRFAAMCASLQTGETATASLRTTRWKIEVTKLRIWMHTSTRSVGMASLLLRRSPGDNTDAEEVVDVGPMLAEATVVAAAVLRRYGVQQPYVQVDVQVALDSTEIDRAF